MQPKWERNLVLAIQIMLILMLPFILYLANFRIAAFDESFYKEEFVKYNVYQSVRNKDVDAINLQLLNYFKYDKTQDLVKIDSFNEREKKHLLDVKNIIQTAVLSMYIIIAVFIVLAAFLFFINRKKFYINLGISLLFGGICTSWISIIAALVAWLGFTSFFDIFHRTFFSAGTWLFNSNDLVVTVYQERFFYDMLVRIVIYTFITALVILTIGALLQTVRRSRRITKPIHLEIKRRREAGKKIKAISEKNRKGSCVPAIYCIVCC